MRLAEKLARLPPPTSARTTSNALSLDGVVPGDDRSARIAHLRTRIAAIERKPAPLYTDRDHAKLSERLGTTSPLDGERVTTDHGTFFRQVSVLEPHHCHGTVAVRGALEANALMLSKLALDASIEGLDLSRALFLDTETTGLSMAAGTVPFLVGVAWFEDESFVIEQLLLEELGEEAPMLVRLAELVERASCIVTYNGKSYDWPLLSTRYVLNRVAPPPARPHVDLLHMARRVFRPRLGGARLVLMEEKVLGMRRERDIDGAEIPGVYWSFLRHKNGAVLSLVMEHNANDLVALAALLAVLSQRIETVRLGDDPIDHLALAKVAFRAKDLPRALSFAQAAAEGGGAEPITADAELLLGDLLKRTKDFANARAAYERAVSVAGRDRLRSSYAHLELAKLQEHRFKDFDRALVHARFTEAIEGVATMNRRIERLGRRIKRAKIPPKKRRRRKVAKTRS